MADNFMDQDEGVEVGYWDKRKAQFNGELARGISGKPTVERKAAAKPADRVRRPRKAAEKPEGEKKAAPVRSRKEAAGSKLQAELEKKYAKMPEALRKAKVASELKKAGE